MKLVAKIIGFSLWKENKNTFFIVNDSTGRVTEKLKFTSFEVERAREALMMYAPPTK